MTERFGALAPRSCGRRETICSPAINLRDVGVAGSNPVTPTIDFNDVFFAQVRLGVSLTTTGGWDSGTNLSRAPSIEPRFVIAIFRFGPNMPVDDSPLVPWREVQIHAAIPQRRDKELQGSSCTITFYGHSLALAQRAYVPKELGDQHDHREH